MILPILLFTPPHNLARFRYGEFVSGRESRESEANDSVDSGHY